MKNYSEKQFKVSNTIDIKKESKDGKEVYPFVLSTESIDRDFEIMKISGMDIKSFKEAPRMFFNHNMFDKPIGKWLNIRKDGKVLKADAWLHEETEESREIKRLIDVGVINTASIGFMSIKRSKKEPPDELREVMKDYWRDSIVIHDKSEIYEASIVTVPSNREAIMERSQKAFDAGKLSHHALQFLEKILKNKGDEMKQPETKAGSVLSKGNKAKLQTARDNIDAVLKSADKEDNQDEEKTLDPNKPVEKLFEKFELISKRLDFIEEKITPSMQSVELLASIPKDYGIKENEPEDINFEDWLKDNDIKTLIEN